MYVKFQYIVNQLPKRGVNSSSIESLSLLVFEASNNCCLEDITPEGNNSHKFCHQWLTVMRLATIS